MEVAVVEQLVLPWVICLLFPPFMRSTLEWGREGLAQGPGHCTYLAPQPWVLHHYLLTKPPWPACPASSHYGLLLSLPPHFSACLSCCSLSSQLHLWGPASVFAVPVLRFYFYFFVSVSSFEAPPFHHSPTSPSSCREARRSNF